MYGADRRGGRITMKFFETVGKLTNSRTASFLKIELLLHLALIVIALIVFATLWNRGTPERTEPPVSAKAENKFSTTIKVVAAANDAPFAYRMKDGSMSGHNIELVNILANRMHVNVEIHLLPRTQALAAIKQKKADLMPGSDLREREIQGCDQTVPVYYDMMVLFGPPELTHVGQLHSKKIGVIKGCGSSSSIKDYSLTQNSIGYNNAAEIARAYSLHKIDCFLVHYNTGLEVLKIQPDKNTAGRFMLGNGNVCIGVAKNKTGLRDKLNKAILEMQQDGTLGALNDKWLTPFYGQMTLENFFRQYAWIALGFLLVIFTNFTILLAQSMHNLKIITKEKDDALKAQKSKTLFFSTVSHDIRTPLNAIIGFAELLDSGKMSPEDERKALLSIKTSGKTLLQLINDVLDLSKLEAGKMELNPEPTDLRDLISAVLNSFDAAVSSKPVELRLNVRENMPFMTIDPQRIRQILFNLIGNAVKFTSKGSITAAASFEPYAESSHEGDLTISVTDTGCGIAEKDQKSLAQAYVQIKQKTGEGTGLGLTICKHLTHNMNGEFSFVSAPGKGSTFSIRIPDVRATAPVRRQSLREVKKTQEAASREKLHLLIADDVAMNISVLKAMLRRIKVTNITTASNGLEALEKLKAAPENFDVVLTDMWMPEMDGTGLIKAIRSEKCWEKLPVYAVTADTEVRKTYSELGFTSILLKPLTIERLSELLDHEAEAVSEKLAKRR